jgi:hypothetical protein
MLTKEAAQEVMAAVPGVLRALVAERDALRAENDGLKEKQASADLAGDVVDLMESRGLGEAGMSRKEKIAALLISGRDLNVLQQAVSMQAPEMSFSKVASSASEGGQSGDRFESYLRGGN